MWIPPITADNRRTRNNPQDNHSHNILAKGNIGNENHRLEAAFEQFYRKNDTELLNTLGSSPLAEKVKTKACDLVLKQGVNFLS